MIETHCLVAGKPTAGAGRLEVRNPYSGEVVGTVGTATATDVDNALHAACKEPPKLTRFERSQLLARTRSLLEAQREDVARLMTHESGLCLRETRYEVGRTLDEVERDYIIQTLKITKDKKKTADMLGISLRTLYNRLAAAPQSKTVGAPE